jgi:hypothetical protein
MNMALGRGMYSPQSKHPSKAGGGGSAVDLPPLPPSTLPSLASKHIPGVTPAPTLPSASVVKEVVVVVMEGGGVMRACNLGLCV